MIRRLLLLLLLAGLSVQVQAQVTRQQLADALQSCEDDLKEAEADVDTLQTTVRALQTALRQTEALCERRATVADTLIANLTQQLGVQDSIAVLMQANADTLQAMVRDYDAKLDEVSNLYIKELEKQRRPWFLTKRGLQGLLYGVLIGGSAGIVLAIRD